MSARDAGFRISRDFVSASNEKLLPGLEREYVALRESLERRGVLRALGASLDDLTDRVAGFSVAVPSWGLSTGGTRFGRFPGPGEPENVFQKLDDAAVIHQLSGGAPLVSLHIPWDEADPDELMSHAAALGLRFDAMNSNTFQDRPGQGLSYKFGSLSHVDSTVRRQAIEHNLDVAALGKAIGSKALTVWIGDGGDSPGQIHFRRSLARTISSLEEIRRKLPADWRLLVEYKPYEPAFYATVIQDWGTALMICQALGDGTFVLVDLGHHLPGTNIEMIVARLISAGKLGGFHLNDSKYGDDDLTAGSIKPYQLFLIFHELVDAEMDPTVDRGTYAPAYMVDQSHNLKDPLEALIATVDEARRAYAKALLVDRSRLDDLQRSNDVLRAELELKGAYETDVRPMIAMARHRRGAAIDPIGVYRASGYRREKARERRADGRTGGGII